MEEKHVLIALMSPFKDKGGNYYSPSDYFYLGINDIGSSDHTSTFQASTATEAGIKYFCKQYPKLLDHVFLLRTDAVSDQDLNLFKERLSDLQSPQASEGFFTDKIIPNPNQEDLVDQSDPHSVTISSIIDLINNYLNQEKITDYSKLVVHLEMTGSYRNLQIVILLYTNILQKLGMKMGKIILSELSTNNINSKYKNLTDDDFVKNVRQYRIGFQDQIRLPMQMLDVLFEFTTFGKLDTINNYLTESLDHETKELLTLFKQYSDSIDQNKLVKADFFATKLNETMDRFHSENSAQVASSNKFVEILKKELTKQIKADCVRFYSKLEFSNNNRQKPKNLKSKILFNKSLETLRKRKMYPQAMAFIKDVFLYTLYDSFPDECGIKRVINRLESTNSEYLIQKIFHIFKLYGRSEDLLSGFKGWFPRDILAQKIVLLLVQGKILREGKEVFLDNLDEKTIEDKLQKYVQYFLAKQKPEFTKESVDNMALVITLTLELMIKDPKNAEYLSYYDQLQTIDNERNNARKLLLHSESAGFTEKKIKSLIKIEQQIFALVNGKTSLYSKLANYIQKIHTNKRQPKFFNLKEIRDLDDFDILTIDDYVLAWKYRFSQGFLNIKELDHLEFRRSLARLFILYSEICNLRNKTSHSDQLKNAIRTLIGKLNFWEMLTDLIEINIEEIRKRFYFANSQDKTLENENSVLSVSVIIINELLRVFNKLSNNLLEKTNLNNNADSNHQELVDQKANYVYINIPSESTYKLDDQEYRLMLPNLERSSSDKMRKILINSDFNTSIPGLRAANTIVKPREINQVWLFLTEEAQKNVQSIITEARLLNPNVQVDQNPIINSKREEIEVAQILLDKIQANDHLLFDITSAFRRFSISTLLYLQIAKYKGAFIESIIYSFFDPNNSLGGNAILCMENILQMSDLAEAINLFINTGRSDSLKKSEEFFKETGQLQLYNSIVSLSNALVLGQVDEILSSHVCLIKQIEKTKMDLEGNDSFQAKLLQQIIPVLQKAIIVRETIEDKNLSFKNRFESSGQEDSSSDCSIMRHDDYLILETTNWLIKRGLIFQVLPILSDSIQTKILEKCFSNSEKYKQALMPFITLHPIFALIHSLNYYLFNYGFASSGQNNLPELDDLLHVLSQNGEIDSLFVNGEKSSFKDLFLIVIDHLKQLEDNQKEDIRAYIDYCFETRTSVNSSAEKIIKYDRVINCKLSDVRQLLVNSFMITIEHLFTLKEHNDLYFSISDQNKKFLNRYIENHKLGSFCSKRRSFELSRYYKDIEKFKNTIYCEKFIYPENYLIQKYFTEQGLRNYSIRDRKEFQTNLVVNIIWQYRNKMADYKYPIVQANCIKKRKQKAESIAKLVLLNYRVKAVRDLTLHNYHYYKTNAQTIEEDGDSVGNIIKSSQKITDPDQLFLYFVDVVPELNQTEIIDLLKSCQIAYKDFLIIANNLF